MPHVVMGEKEARATALQDLEACLEQMGPGVLFNRAVQPGDPLDLPSALHSLLKMEVIFATQLVKRLVAANDIAAANKLVHECSGRVNLIESLAPKGEERRYWAPAAARNKLTPLLGILEIIEEFSTDSAG